MKIRLFAFFALITFVPLTASAASGIVTHTIDGCDYFVVEADAGFSLLEMYGGPDPERGDEIVGDIESYGVHKIYNKTNDTELSVWVEEFWLSEDDALEELVEECD